LYVALFACGILGKLKKNQTNNLNLEKDLANSKIKTTNKLNLEKDLPQASDE